MFVRREHSDPAASMQHDAGRRSFVPLCLRRHLCFSRSRFRWRRSHAIAFLFVAYAYFGLGLASVPTTTEITSFQTALALMRDGNDTCTKVEGGEFLIYNDEGTNSTYPFVALHHLIRNPPPPVAASARAAETLASVNTSAVRSPAAVCEFDTNFHFPHFVQFVMRCFSYWHSRPHQPPVLLIRRPRFRQICDLESAARRWPFNAGILAGLRYAIKLRVVMFDPSDPEQKKNVSIVPFMESRNPVAPPFAVSSSGAAAALHSIYVDDFVANDSEGEHARRTQGQRPPSPLRIAVIGRPKYRRLLNVHAVQHALSVAFPEARVVVKYLENTTFLEQVDFFHAQDVVISPHGAQLTNMLFLAPCAAVLELFPCGYWLPDYFASLAATMGVLHANWYVCDEAPPDGFVELSVRLANSENNMCPAAEKVVAGTQDLLARRRRCLDQQSSA